jgi:membrane-associated phospholipid phosphatase
MAATQPKGAGGIAGEPNSGFRFGLELSIAAIIVVVSLGALASASTGWTHGELEILQGISRVHTPVLDSAALFFDWVFSPAIAPIVLVIAAAVTLFISRSVRTATQLVVLTGLAWGGADLIKVLVHRHRPDIASLAHILVAHPGGFGFPSGHTAFASSLAMGLLVISRQWRFRRALVVIVTVIAVLTGLSRVYLGVHYPADVVGSWLYSAAAVVLLDSLWNRFVLPRWSGRRLW